MIRTRLAASRWPAQASAGPEPPADPLTDLLLFAAMPFSGVEVSGLPLSEMAMAAAALYGWCRPRTVPRLPPWFVLLVGAIPAWMGTVAVIQGEPAYRRALHLTLYAVLAVLLAQGRFSMRAAARGLALGLVASVGAGFWGIGADYTGRLSGFVGDPNSAGYYLTALGSVAVAQLRPGRARTIFILASLALVYLTLSRTTLLAAGLIAAWLTYARRTAAPVAVGFLAMATYLIGHIPEDLKVFGPFAGRTGSDSLRQRISAVEHLQVSSAQWIGHGPGTSRVLVDGNWFFFHNSYLAVRNEAGWVGLALVLTLGVLVLLRLLRQPPEHRHGWNEGALVAVAVCSMSLGEVLLELPAAVVLGAAMHQLMAQPEGPSVRSQQ